MAEPTHAARGAALSTFPVDEVRLKSLAATRGGRVALGGFEYQRAFALLRLGALALHQPVGGGTEVPVLLRYEWAEDIDELCTDGRVVMWQCKHGDNWHTPAPLADVLLGFAAKWLWTPPDQRPRLAFRLVTSDRAFAAHHDLPGPLPDEAKIATTFAERMAQSPGERSDRALWQTEAAAVGHAALFQALRGATRVLYMPGTTAANSRTWAAEQQAVDALARGGRVADPGRAAEIIAALRPLLDIHTHHVADAQGCIVRPNLPPCWLRPFEVEHRLLPFSPRPSLARLVTVDRTRLKQVLAAPPGPAYVARRPEWRDVVRGADAQVRFLERAQTDDLVLRLRRALADSLRHEGGLRLVPVLGAPGAGKSTLALRAAAKLVLEDRCLTVDMRHSLDTDEDPRDLIDALQTLGSGTQSVLLLLDDPLGAGSGWPQVLQKLGRSHPAIVVLAAMPDFLYDRHRAELRTPVQLLPALIVHRPDAAERDALAALYPETDARRIVDGDEDLLVLAMQAAADMSFDAIVAGIWDTLAGGTSISPDVVGDELPWPVAVFALVCWFHRAYAACPLPLLQSFLAGRKDVGDNGDERLRTMVQRQGWRIFQVQAWKGPANFAYVGGAVFAMHARVAQRAWHLRPAMGWDIGSAIARASVAASMAAYTLGTALATLHRHDPEGVSAVMGHLGQAWTADEANGAIETRSLCELTETLLVGGVPIPQWLRLELLRRAQLAEPDGWLAAQQLHFLSAGASAQRRFPDELPLDTLIDIADFSVAPNRATKFANALEQNAAALHRFTQRLWAALDGRLQWTLDSSLLTWLLARGARSEVRRQMEHIRSWLQDHPDDNFVRTKFVDLLGELNLDERAKAIGELRIWLLCHPDDTVVRTKLVNLLGELNPDERVKAIDELRTWLRGHPDDNSVRTKFIGLLGTLGANDRANAIDELRVWLRNHPDDTSVRSAFLSTKSDRLGYLQSIDLDDVLEWQVGRPHDTSVRASVISVLLARNDDRVPNVLTDTLRLSSRETAWFHPATLALLGCARLPPTQLRLTCNWLDWAALVLRQYLGNRAAETVAKAALEPAATVKGFMAKKVGALEDRVFAEGILATLTHALREWYGSIGKPPPRL